MKRHPALQDLSRDHHVVLQWTLRIRQTLQAGQPVASLLTAFHQYAENELEPHFAEEEAILVPHAGRVPGGRRVLDQHNELRRLVGEVADAAPDSGRQRELAGILETALTRHVRDEEASFFEPLQRTLAAHELDAIGAESRAFRMRERNPDACFVPPPTRSGS